MACTVYINTNPWIPSRELAYPTKREKEYHRLKHSLGGDSCFVPRRVIPEYNFLNAYSTGISHEKRVLDHLNPSCRIEQSLVHNCFNHNHVQPASKSKRVWSRLRLHQPALEQISRIQGVITNCAIWCASQHVAPSLKIHQTLRTCWGCCVFFEKTTRC